MKKETVCPKRILDRAVGAVLSVAVVCPNLVLPAFSLSASETVGIPFSETTVILLIFAIVLLMGLLLVAFDNHKNRLSMENLRLKDAYLQKLIDAMPDGIGVFEKNMQNTKNPVQVIYLNDGYYRMMKDTREHRFRQLEKNLTAFVHPEDCHKLFSEKSWQQTGESLIQRTIRLQSGEGNYLWITLRANMIRQVDGTQVFCVSFTDATITKLVQEQLKESKTSLQAAMDHAGMYYFEYYPERRIVLEDSRSQSDMGVPNIIENYPEAWFHLGITHPDDLPILKEALHRIEKGASEISCDIRNRFRSGEYRWERMQLSSVYDRDGRRIKMVGTGTDITEQKAAAAEYERRMEQVKVAIPDPIVSFRVNLTQNLFQDAETNYQDLKETQNRSATSLFEAMYGRSVTETERMEFQQILNRESLLHRYEHGETMVIFERRAWVSGQIHWISIRIFMARHPVSGDVESLIYSFGIDQQKYMEQIVSLVVRNDYIELLQINLHDNTMRKFRTGQKELSPDEIPDAQETLEQNIRQFYVGEIDDFICKNRFSEIRRNLETKEEYILYASYRDKKGQIRRLKGVYCWLDKVQQLVCCTISDITDALKEEQRRNEELQQALHAAELASRAKSDFLSRMSHEIRTPMNAILGLTQLGLNDSKDPEAIDALGKIRDSGEYLLGLINDVLDMSRIESGKIILHPVNTDTRNFFDSISTIIEPKMSEKQIHFQLDVSGVTTRYVVMDKMRMQQIYINLLNNAVKFSDNGTTIFCSAVHETDEKGKLFSRIVIRDQGCGMSEEFQKRAFQPFEQEHNRHSDAQAGTGLGLAIVKNLVEQMGGTITVKSKLDAGTEFMMMIPLVKGEKPECSEEREVGSTQVNLEGQRILLVEDHTINTEIARRLLEHEGMLVEHAENGQIAVEMFRNQNPGYYRAILMDIRMPVMDGIESTKAIRATIDRKDAKTIPIIAMTANAFDTDRQATKNAGMNEHLSKPIRPDELYRTLRRFLA